MSIPAKPDSEKDEREQRLAAALRENLRRRKAQAREQVQAKEPDKTDEKSG